MDELLQAGTQVEFDDFEDPSVKLRGVILAYLEPKKKFLGGYHIDVGGKNVDRYYVVPPQNIRVITPSP